MVGAAWTNSASAIPASFVSRHDYFEGGAPRIGRMIAYQEYNTKSPLSGLAAKWAAQNAGLLPIDTRNIAPPSEAAEASVPSDATNVSHAENASTPQSNDPWSQKISLG
jgi:hypothetical protein